MKGFIDIYYFIKNRLLKLIMSYLPLWWFIQKHFNCHFLCTVIGIIRDDQGRILMLEHTYRPSPLALPSGFIKKGETPFDALKREVKEEVNFDILPTRILDVIPSSKFSLLEFKIEAKYLGGIFIPSKEVNSYKWSEKTDFNN